MSDYTTMRANARAAGYEAGKLGLNADSVAASADRYRPYESDYLAGYERALRERS